jgi:hypothetical protein
MANRANTRPVYRIFILSPARAAGKRANLLFSPRARFDLAVRLRTEGAPLGEIFSFLSGLYFRGKLAYANKFARTHRHLPGVLVITSDRGLVPADTRVTIEDLLSFGNVPIDPANKRYSEALQTSAINLAERLSSKSEIVLLGSIGTKKYAELLVKIFGSRLKFPADFVGRGDMSRGGLLLRSVESGQELEYVSVIGAIRHGKRPPKLEPRRWGPA